jgi:hypothetical protein
VQRGLKIRNDRHVVSRELGTTTFKQVWNQRLRWAQGWFQVTRIHTARVWRSPGLTLRQKLGATYLLGWREVYPWLSLQIFPLVAFWMLTRGDRLSSGYPILLCTTLFVLHVGPMQTLYAYRLADDEIKQHKSWFWGYLLFSTFFYTEWKNTIARVAHIKEFVGERAWKVTPRSNDPVEFYDEAFVDVGEVGAAAAVVTTTSTGSDAAVPALSQTSSGDVVGTSESARLNRAVSRLSATPGMAGDPLVPGPSARPASHRPEHSQISRRVRELVEQGVPIRPAAGEPLLAPRLFPRAAEPPIVANLEQATVPLLVPQEEYESSIPHAARTADESS